MFDKIESLKRQYTDKYVIVDENCPELKRFKGLTGTVRTVNMSGRALVEFDGHNNIGWFDIELDYLKIIDQPLPKPEEKAGKKGEKPAAKAAPAEKPVAKAPAAGAPKMSVADMLAAARTGAAKTEGATAKKESAPAAEKLAAPAKAASTAKVDPKKTSTADILAMARGGKPAGGATAKPAPTPVEEAADEPAAEEPAADEPVAEEAPVPVAEKPKKAAAGDKKPTSIEDIVAYCRKIDTK